MDISAEQMAARAEGMKRGVPEAFAINCKVRAYSNVTVAGTQHKSGDTFTIYDSRTRDKLRKARAIAVLEDAWFVQFNPGTIAAQVEPTTQGTRDEQTPADPGTQTEGAAPTGDGPTTRRARRRRTAPRG